MIILLVCVNFDALAMGKWYQIERRQVVFLCWMHNLNPGFLEPNLQQTECPLQNWLSYLEDRAKNFELNSLFLWSVNIQPTWPQRWYGFTPVSSDIHVCWYWFWCTGNKEVILNQKEPSCVPLLNAGFESRVSGTESPADWMPTDKPTELLRIKLKTWNQLQNPTAEVLKLHLQNFVSWAIMLSFP